MKISRFAPCMILISGLLFGGPLLAQPTSSSQVADTGKIRVSGSAAVSVDADRARLIFAVETQEPEASEAAQANAARMSSALAAVREAAGEGSSVETRGYSLRAVYDEVGRPDRTRREVVGFMASNTLVVTLTDLDAVGPTLDAAVSAGANRIDGIQFFAEDTRDAYLQALDMAVSNALEEAGVIANAAGGALGEVIEVLVGSGQPGPQFRMAMDMQEASTPVEPGSQSVNASVTVVVRLGSR